MKLSQSDLNWLSSNYPELVFLPSEGRIEGELRFCAAFKRETNKLMIGDEEEHREARTFLCDSFQVRIELATTIPTYLWPPVYEESERRYEIARQNNCQVIDLHFYEDGSCCLAFGTSPKSYGTIDRFVSELVVPFFYRLSYTDRYGLQAARSDLWGEYSHGARGEMEYIREILAIAETNPSRRRSCPCGSGSKYKRCHLPEVQTVTAFLKGKGLLPK